MGNKNKDGFTELVITNLNPDIKSKLKTIAKNKVTTVSCMLRPVLREFVDKHPKEQREFID